MIVLTQSVQAQLSQCEDVYGPGFDPFLCERFNDLHTLTPYAPGTDLDKPAFPPLPLGDETGFLAELVEQQHANGRQHFLDKHRIYFTQQFQDIANTFDRFMAQKDYAGENPNESYFILNSELIFNEYGDHELSFRGKAKVDLADTKKRFKLIFESQPDEDVSLRNTERPNRRDSEGFATDDSIAGLEYAKEREEFAWRPAIDAGSRLNFPLDVFVRLKIAKKTKLSEKSLLYTRFELPYFAREGAIPSTKVTWEYALLENWSFRSITRYKYTEEQKFNEWAQSLQLNHYFSDDIGIEYKVGAFGDDTFNPFFSTYYFHIGFKLNLYDHWLYLSLVPAVEFDVETDWHPDYSFGLQLQAVYSN